MGGLIRKGGFEGRRRRELAIMVTAVSAIVVLRG
jgi:hypothetical protein